MHQFDAKEKQINMQSNQLEKKSGLFLRYQDFKSLERILESYNLDQNGNINFTNMKLDEKDLLRKIKIIIYNMETVRLRLTGEEKEQLRQSQGE